MKSSPKKRSLVVIDEADYMIADNPGPRFASNYTIAFSATYPSVGNAIDLGDDDICHQYLQGPWKFKKFISPVPAHIKHPADPSVLVRGTIEEFLSLYHNHAKLVFSTGDDTESV